MKRLFGKILLLCAMLLSAGVSVNAWHDVGHKITAYIAWQRMSPTARENVIRILRSAPEDSHLSTFYPLYGVEPDEVRKREYFMLAATWADIVRDPAFPVRSKRYHKRNWHFDDTFWRQVDGKVVPLSGFEEGGQGVKQLFEAERTMRDTKSTDADKALSIAWIMHIGGDLHMPLHTSARVTDLEPKGDQGGNLFMLTPQGTARENQVNLHFYWDSITERSIPIKGETCERDYIEPIARKMMKKHSFSELQSGMNLGKYDEWQRESFAYNPTDVFSPDLVRYQMPSAKYRKNAFKLAQRQLALAGYRLGETLNDIFGRAAIIPQQTP